MSRKMSENLHKAKDGIARIIAFSFYQGAFKGRSVKDTKEFIRGNIDSVLSLYGYN